MPGMLSDSDISRFDRCNLFTLALERGSQHGGQGEISFRRIAAREDLDGACNYIDYAEIPAGCTIGLHRHGMDEEEIFLVLGGAGEMSRESEVFRVRAGDLIRNPPGGTHSLSNLGTETIRLFVIQLGVTR